MAVTALTFVAAVIAGLLTTALLTPPLRSRANTWLGFTFGVIAWLAFMSGRLTLGWDATAYVVLNDLMPELLVPVGILMYFAVLLDDKLASGDSCFVLLIPFVATTVINLLLDGSSELEVYVLPAWATPSALDTYYIIEEAFTIGYAVALAVATTALLRRHRGHVAYPWARRLWTWIAGTILVWALTYIASIWIEAELLGIVWAVVLVLLCAVVYNGILGLRLLENRRAIALRLTQARLAPKLEPDVLPHPVTNPVSVQIPGPHSSSAPDPSVDVLAIPATTAELALPNPHLAALDRLLMTEHSYRDPDLSRALLASKIGISGSHLGRLLSRAGRPTFSQLVTEHRVRAVKTMLLNPEFAHFSIVAIGLESGFRSKSSFNHAFKDAVGMTPSAYRQQGKEITPVP